MTRLQIPEHATVAHLERLIMRFPCSIRLKLKLQEAKQREAREKEMALKRLRGQIRKSLMVADLSTLQKLAEVVNG
jgi:hypothetical protein